MRPLKRPNRKTSLFALPRKREDWVFAVGAWPPRSTKLILGGLRLGYRILRKREQIILITPEPGHEIAIWNICTRLFFRVERGEAERFLAQ